MSKRATRILFLVFAAALFLVQPVLAQSPAARPVSNGNPEPEIEEVTSFSSDIVVSKDGTISVTERINYNFPEPRHGIYRDIPIRYELDNGDAVIVPIEIVSVEGGPHKIEKTRSTMRIRIGNPDKTITGMHTYTIKYIATGALRYFDEHDELYWNVTGNEWNVPFRRVTAQVYLPESVEQDSIMMKCFTGPAGSTEMDCLYHRSKGGASFAADDMLTVVVSWKPKGLVAYIEPKYPSIWTDVIIPASPWIAYALLPIAVFVFMFRRWRNQGRDPRGRGTIVVQYDPPNELTPAELGVLLDERADIKDISATIVDLAVRGYLKIKELPKKFLTSQDFEFTRLKDFGPNGKLLKHEQIVMSIMFSGRDSVTLRKLIKDHAFNKKMQAINDALYEKSVSDGYFDKNPHKVRSRYVIIGAICMFAGLMLGLAGIPIMLSGAAILLFGRAMPRKTRQGMRGYEHALGFREYIAKAEKYRLQWQEKEHMFEKFLPYAMVYGVVDKWTEAFKNINIPPPDWYEGSVLTAGHFNAVSFAGAMGGLESGLIKAVSSKPQKSSGGSGFSSGGGFSGGGFGGGGGGSW